MLGWSTGRPIAVTPTNAVAGGLLAAHCGDDGIAGARCPVPDADRRRRVVKRAPLGAASGCSGPPPPPVLGGRGAQPQSSAGADPAAHRVVIRAVVVA